MEENGDTRGIINGIDKAMLFSTYVGLVPELQVPLIKLTTFLGLGNPLAAVNDFIDPQIHDRAKGKMAPTRSNSEDMLTKLLRLENESNNTRLDTIHALGQNIAAGSDTTAISMTSVIAQLALNPDKMRSLRHELDEASHNGTLSNPARFQEAQKLPYLQAVIMEGIRMHPAVGVPLVRVVPEGGAQIAGRYFPAGVSHTFINHSHLKEQADCEMRYADRGRHKRMGDPQQQGHLRRGRRPLRAGTLAICRPV